MLNKGFSIVMVAMFVLGSVTLTLPDAQGRPQQPLSGQGSPMYCAANWSGLEALGNGLGIRDRDRLRDGSCTDDSDGVPDQLRTRDRIHW